MKKSILIILITGYFMPVAYFTYYSYKLIDAQKVFIKKVKRLPKLANFQWINKQVPNHGVTTVILFFNPRSEYYQDEVKTILKHLPNATTTNFWWVAMVDSSVICNFSKKIIYVTFPIIILLNSQPKKLLRLLV